MFCLFSQSGWAISRDITFLRCDSIKRFGIRSSSAIQLATLYCDMPWHDIASGLRFDVRFDSRHLFYNCFQVCWVSHAGASCDSFRVSMQRLLNSRSAFRSLRYSKRVSRPISNRSYRSYIEFIAILPSLGGRMT